MSQIGSLNQIWEIFFKDPLLAACHEINTGEPVYMYPPSPAFKNPMWMYRGRFFTQERMGVKGKIILKCRDYKKTGCMARAWVEGHGSEMRCEVRQDHTCASDEMKMPKNEGTTITLE